MGLHRIRKILNKFNMIGYTEDGMNRLAYTEGEKEAKELFRDICEQEGMTVRMDAAGNMIARREGLYPELPPVVVGSHIDTVFNGGKYDGTVGVVTGIELIARLNEQQKQTDHPIEIISFAAEESSRFSISTLGSKLMTGQLDKADIENVSDTQKISLPQAFSDVGLDFQKINEATREKGFCKAFFEAHIEQGPILEQAEEKIGIVTGIAAPTRLHVKIEGKAAHSGSTPMHMRKDALLAASEIALTVEEAALSEKEQGSVATVGMFDVSPGAMNVIPGETELKIDIRGIDVQSKQRIVENITKKIQYIERNRNLTIHKYMLMDDRPVPLDETVIASIEKTCDDMGVAYRKMPSGAGHDAMNMATICPTGLIFIPCRDGLSHHKEEYADIEDILIGCDVLEKELIKWARAEDNMVRHTNGRYIS